MAVALLALGAVFVTVSYFGNAIDRSELSKIERENSHLRTVNERFETSIRQLETQLGDYQQRIHELAIVAGMTVVPESGEGIGGLAPAGSGLQADIGVLERRLEQLGSGVDALAGKLAERSLRIASTPAVTPVRGLMTSRYGYRRDPFNGRRAFHSGIDIIAPRGREVQASGDAIVTRAGRIGALGNAVYLSHGYGITSRYGHLLRATVKPGDRVKRGDVIGYVGNTGRSTGYHLHYEVRVDGKPVDPRAYILDRIRSD